MEYAEEFSFVTPYLQSGEYILWRGRPAKGNVFSGRDMVMIPFSLVWLAFCIFWEWTAIKSGSSVFMMLWGLPFIAVGLYMLFGGFIRRAHLRDKTFYVITNQKIIVKSGRNINMYDGAELPPMQIKLHKNGNGTILFADEVYTRRGRMHATYCALENLTDIAQAQKAVATMKQYSDGRE